MALAGLCVVGALAACAKEAVVSSEPQVVTVRVFSGRPQPSASEHGVHANQAVVVRVEGLGPPRVTIVGPDGMPLAASTSPLVQDGSTMGAEVRFTPAAPGIYRVDDADAPGTTLARLNAS